MPELAIGACILTIEREVICVRRTLREAIAEAPKMV